MSETALDPKDVIEQFYAGLVSGDPERMHDLIDDDAIVDYYGPDHAFLPWSGTWLGFDGFLEFLKTVGDHVDVISVTTEKSIGDENHVVTVVESHWRMRQTGYEVISRSANIFTVRDGRILRYEIIADTASLSAAFKGSFSLTV